jgi:DNA-binding transcriptional regulator YhcF (GntR family)
MEFRNDQAIYLQIVDYVCERILLQSWKAEERVTSIRDMAIELQVTPNTVQRSYDFLQQLDIISNRRGVGYFVERDALKRVVKYKKEEFIKVKLPVFFKTMSLLNLDMKEVETLFTAYLNTKLKK